MSTLSTIQKAIDTARQNGKNCIIKNLLSKKIVSELEALGYSVQLHKLKNNQSIHIISWENLVFPNDSKPIIEIRESDSPIKEVADEDDDLYWDFKFGTVNDSSEITFRDDELMAIRIYVDMIDNL